MTALEIADIIQSKYDPANEMPLELCDRLFGSETAQAVIDAMHLCIARAPKLASAPLDR